MKRSLRARHTFFVADGVAEVAAPCGVTAMPEVADRHQAAPVKSPRPTKSPQAMVPPRSKPGGLIDRGNPMLSSNGLRRLYRLRRPLGLRGLHGLRRRRELRRPHCLRQPQVCIAAFMWRGHLPTTHKSEDASLCDVVADHDSEPSKPRRAVGPRLGAATAAPKRTAAGSCAWGPRGSSGPSPQPEDSSGRGMLQPELVRRCRSQEHVPRRSPAAPKPSVRTNALARSDVNISTPSASTTSTHTCARRGPLAQRGRGRREGRLAAAQPGGVEL